MCLCVCGGVRAKEALRSMPCAAEGTGKTTFDSLVGVRADVIFDRLASIRAQV